MSRSADFAIPEPLIPDDHEERIAALEAGGTGGANVAIGPSPPSGPSTGDLWVDTTSLLRAVWIGTYPPPSPQPGDAWLDIN
jgi:hypothetical protein